MHNENTKFEFGKGVMKGGNDVTIYNGNGPYALEAAGILGQDSVAQSNKYAYNSAN